MASRSSSTSTHTWFRCAGTMCSRFTHANQVRSGHRRLPPRLVLDHEPTRIRISGAASRWPGGPATARRRPGERAPRGRRDRDQLHVEPPSYPHLRRRRQGSPPAMNRPAALVLLVGARGDPTGSRSGNASPLRRDLALEHFGHVADVERQTFLLLGRARRASRGGRGIFGGSLIGLLDCHFAQSLPEAVGVRQRICVEDQLRTVVGR